MPTPIEVGQNLLIELQTKDELDEWIRTFGYKDYCERREFCENFSFAVPCVEAVRVIAKYTPIVEVGCGSGYWAKILLNNGVDVVATNYDCGVYLFKNRFTTILNLTAKQVVETMAKTVLTCWPSMDNWCEDIIGARTIIYIGEGYSGCCGTDEFHNMIDEFYEPIEYCEIPNWFTVHDKLVVYERIGR